ncbi:MAG: hypothetical protein NZM18_06695 [Thermoflexales bacterium]|nr:hypothetical protein [Thermoflexales bacterium]
MEVLDADVDQDAIRRRAIKDGHSVPSDGLSLGIAFDRAKPD